VERQEKNTNSAESIDSDIQKPAAETRGGLLKLGAIAVASALLGGVAAAWWYRKTIQKLHETGESNRNPHFGIDADQPQDETTEEV
jgi:hypothetical protein